MIGRTVGRFRILERLGQGGMATVWKAEDPLLRRQIALKVLAPELAREPLARKRFRNEAISASRCDHPGIAAIYETGEDGDLCFIALAIVPGRTLADLVARGPLPVADVLHVAIAVSEALEHAHGRGVLHRDVTSRNVMVGPGGRVVLLDFGLALAADVTRLTSADSTLGTLPYLAPEVARGESADARSDLYGLGVVLYEALAGARPFRAERREGLMYAILHEPPTRLREMRVDVPEAVDRLVLRLLAKERAMRPADAGELLEELRALRDACAERAGVVDAAPSARTDDVSVPEGTEPIPSRRAEVAHVPDEIYLAVLPFEDADAGRAPAERAAFAPGWAHVLSAALARLPGLHVIPPVGGGAGVETDLRRFARTLGANLVLTGAVRRSGSDVRVTWTLADPHRATRLGGETLEGTSLDLFDLEDRVVASVVAALGVERPAAPPVERGSRDPAAREKYVQALGYLHRWENEASVDGAIALLERLVGSEGESPERLAALARAYLHKYRLTYQRSWESRAAQAAQRAHELSPESPDVLHALGDLRTSSGQFEQSIRDYRRALALRSDHVEAWLGLAAAFLGAGRREEAEKALEEAIRLRPDDWRAYNRLARLDYERGDYEQALAHWRTVVRLSPDNPRGHAGAANALHGLHRLEEARAAYERSIAIQPTASAYTNLGTILYDLGHPEEALAAFRSGVSLRPSDPRTWGHLGSACRWTPGHEAEAAEALDAAIARMEDALRHHPGNPDDWCLLASWLANRDRFAAARAAIDRALSAAPESPGCLAEAAAVHELAGDRDAALAWAGKALQRGLPIFMLTRNPALTSLLSSPEFQSLRKRHAVSEAAPPVAPSTGGPS